MSEGRSWPKSRFWDFSLELYGRPGVEKACLELQSRHALDVNLLLLCCWLAARGIGLDHEHARRVARAVEDWQREVVRPLRAVRRRLKVKLADPERESVPDLFFDLAGGLRAGILGLELDGEHLEQLALDRLTAELPAQAAADVALAAANLARFWCFEARDGAPLRTLLENAFPTADPSQIDAALRQIAG